MSLVRKLVGKVARGRQRASAAGMRMNPRMGGETGCRSKWERRESIVETQWENTLEKRFRASERLQGTFICVWGAFVKFSSYACFRIGMLGAKWVRTCVGKEGTSQSYKTPLLLASGALRGWNNALANLRTVHVRYITGHFQDIPTRYTFSVRPRSWLGLYPLWVLHNLTYCKLCVLGSDQVVVIRGAVEENCRTPVKNFVVGYKFL